MVQSEVHTQTERSGRLAAEARLGGMPKRKEESGAAARCWRSQTSDPQASGSKSPISGTLNHDIYVYVHKYLGQAYFPVSVGAKK